MIMESAGHVTVPLRAGGKKMRKRRELDALVAHSLAKRACSSSKRNGAGNGVTSQDQLLSQSTDEQEDYTWPKVRSTSRCRTKRLSCLRTCGPFVLITCVFMSFGFMYWLYFDLRQQINEYRMRIEQVSATSQNVPEALQKWHVTSKNLEGNQTNLQKGILQINQIINNLTIEFNHLKDEVDKKNEQSADQQLTTLRGDIAGFGAQIKDFNAQISQFKEQFTQLQIDEKLVKENISRISSLLEATVNRTNSSTAVDQKGLIDMIDKLKKTIDDRITGLDMSLNTVNYTFGEQTKGIASDLKTQQDSLNKFEETFAKLSAKVLSVEQDWTAHKPAVIEYETISKNLTQDLVQFSSRLNNLNNSFNLVQSDCQKNNDFLKQIIQTNSNNDKVQNTPPKTTTTTSPPFLIDNIPTSTAASANQSNKTSESNVPTSVTAINTSALSSTG